MSRLGGKLKVVAAQVRRGDLHQVAATVGNRLWSDDQCYLLRADADFARSDGVPVLDARPTSLADVERGLSPDAAENGEDRELRLRRINIARAGLGTGYGIWEDGVLAYVQWAFGPEDNAGLLKHFGAAMPQLAADEMLLEGAFVLGPFRGKGLFPAGISAVGRAARRPDTRWFRTPVGVANIPTLRGCARIGFRPDEVRTDHWRLFRLKATVAPVGSDLEWPPAKGSVPIRYS